MASPGPKLQTFSETRNDFSAFYDHRILGLEVTSFFIELKLLRFAFSGREIGTRDLVIITQNNLLQITLDEQV